MVSAMYDTWWGLKGDQTIHSDLPTGTPRDSYCLELLNDFCLNSFCSPVNDVDGFPPMSQPATPCFFIQSEHPQGYKNSQRRR